MYILTMIFPVYILIRGIVCKVYRYIPASIIMFLLLVVQNLPPNPEYAYTEYLGVAEKVLLAALSTVLIFCAFPDGEGKWHSIPPILTCTALVIRIIRTIVFDRNIEHIALLGVDAVIEFSMHMGVMDSAVRILIFGMLICVAWQLRKKNPTVE